MKVYIAASHKGIENKQHIEELCKAVRDAKMADFCFIRDIQNYEDKITDQKLLWDKIYDEIGSCDAFLIDVSGHPTSSRLVEMGIAFALRKPIIVVERQGTHHKELFYGVSSAIIKYKDLPDLTRKLKEYDDDRVFNVTDKMTMLVMFLMAGGLFAWFLSQIWIPLAFFGAFVYWLLVRRMFRPIQAYDRLVIFIPLIAIWLTGFYVLRTVYLVFALAWLILFWIIALYILKKMKLSL